MKHVYETYGCTMVGTFALTSKKSRSGADFPVHKLSNGAMKYIDLRWMRTAVKTVQTRRGSYVVQGTVWRDKKEVGFLHNHLVGPSDDHYTKRWTKVDGVSKHAKIKSPEVQADYAKYMNGIDQCDHDTSDYSVSICTNRYYLQIFSG